MIGCMKQLDFSNKNNNTTHTYHIHSTSFIGCPLWSGEMADRKQLDFSKQKQMP